MKLSGNTRGILLMTGSSLVLCGMASIVKILQGVHPTVTVFYRFFMGLSILGLGSMLGFVKLKFNNNRLLLLRGLVGGIVVFVFYRSIQKLGIGKGTVILYSYPIFASFFSMIILREKIAAIKWIFIISAFIGLFFLSVGFGIGSEEPFKINRDVIIAIAGSMCAGFTAIMIKSLHNRDNSVAIFFAQCIVGVWIFLAPSGLVNQQMNLSILLLLLLMGVLATIGQLLMTESYRLINVSTASTLHLLVPVFNLIAGVVIFNEVLDIDEIIGSLLIILSCAMIVFGPAILNIFRKRKGRSDVKIGSDAGGHINSFQ